MKFPPEKYPDFTSQALFLVKPRFEFMSTPYILSDFYERTRYALSLNLGGYDYGV
jgi:hypothetical protein